MNRGMGSGEPPIDVTQITAEQDNSAIAGFLANSDDPTLAFLEANSISSAAAEGGTVDEPTEYQRAILSLLRDNGVGRWFRGGMQASVSAGSASTSVDPGGEQVLHRLADLGFATVTDLRPGEDRPPIEYQLEITPAGRSALEPGEVNRGPLMMGAGMVGNDLVGADPTGPAAAPTEEIPPGRGTSGGLAAPLPRLRMQAEGTVGVGPLAPFIIGEIPAASPLLVKSAEVRAAAVVELRAIEDQLRESVTEMTGVERRLVEDVAIPSLVMAMDALQGLDNQLHGPAEAKSGFALYHLKLVVRELGTGADLAGVTSLVLKAIELFS